MALFHVHAPKTFEAGGLAALSLEEKIAATDELVFTPEKFSALAVLLTIFWFVIERAWYGLGLALALYLLLQMVGSLVGLTGQSMSILMLGFSFAMGLFAQDIKRWSLEQNGYQLIDLVNGKNLAEAEQIFFKRLTSSP